MLTVQRRATTTRHDQTPLFFARLGLLTALVVGLTERSAAAETDVTLSAAAVVSNLDAGGDLRLQVDLGRAVQLGFRGRGLEVRETYVAGFEENSGGAAEGLAYASLRIARRGSAELRLRVGVGARGSFLDSTRDDLSVRLLTELGPMIHWRVAEAWTVRVGWIQVTDLELSPSTDLAVSGALFRLGATARVAARWAIFAEAEVGGVAGYGGDNEKVQARGTVGIQVALDAPAEPEAPASDVRAVQVGAFVGLEWRAMALAGHASHGPGVSAGITLLDGLIRIGIMGFTRPGPLNPATFDITPANGLSYRGQNTVTPRSDGGFFGLLLESEFGTPGLAELRLIPSVALGNAIFGFYLTGEDRNTPDGRRVSAWEDDLQDGRDAGAGFGVEPGLRIAWQPRGLPIRPYIAARYLIVVGYDAYATDNYDGFSAALGAEFVF